MRIFKFIELLPLLSFLSFFNPTHSTDGILPVELNDDNFEHLTQASTGQTTGKWLVNFMSPGCYHCNQLAPIWDDLAHELGTEYKDLGIINAKVNLIENIELRKRFDINAFPTILYFCDRKLYRYEGARSVDAFVEFATKSYKSGAAETVPRPMAGWHKIMQLLRKKAADNKLLKDLVTDFEHIVDVRKNAAFFLLVCGFVFGMLVAILLSVMCGTGKQTIKVKKS